MAGIVKVIKGPGGGQELLGDPTVGEVLDAVGTDKFLHPKEHDAYRTGVSQGRVVAQLVGSLNSAVGVVLKRKISNLTKELAANEIAQLDKAFESGKAWVSQ